MTFIRNESAYEAAIQRRIKQNAATTRRRNWEAAHADASRLHAWLNQCGEFRSTCACGFDHAADYTAEHTDACATLTHPAVRGMYAGDFGVFLGKLRDQLDESGSLSDAQTAAVRKALARAEQRIVERAQQREAQRAANAATVHVGTVGQRTVFKLRLERQHSYETQFGVTFINVCRDEANNIVVYKGSNYWELGRIYEVKATVKEHSMYDGAPQTLIQRPTVISETYL